MEYEMTGERKCSQCRWALVVEVGYSCFTWLGTEVTCKLGRNTASPFDKLDAADDFAQKCKAFFYGPPEYDDSLFIEENY